MIFAVHLTGAEMTTALALLSAGIVTVACIVLIFHPDYEDGLFGRIGLGLIVLASFSRVLSSVGGEDAPLSGIAVFLWVGLAIFLTRHVCRFLWLRRSASWRPANK